MIGSDQPNHEILFNLKLLLGNRKRLDISSEVKEIEQLILQHIADRRLDPRLSSNIIDGLLLLDRPHIAKSVIDYLLSINSEDKFLLNLALYLDHYQPSKEDILKASYYLKSIAYDISWNKENIRISQIVTRFVRRNMINNIGTIIDLGCGTGLIGTVLRDIGFSGSITGVDLSRDMLFHAQKKQLYNNLYCGKIQDYLGQLSQGSFEAVFLIGVAPHLDFDDTRSILKSVEEKIVSPGIMVFNLPNMPDIRANCSNSATIEPVLKTMRIRYQALDHGERRYYCCRL